MDKIVAVSINGMFTPLPNSSVWDGSLESPYVNQFAPYICALFGGCAFDDEVSPTVKVAQNHVFESAQFPELVKQLQIGFNQTGAPIANLIVRTVENTHWGIAAGRKIDFTLLYPAQWKQFESKLPTDTQASIVNGAIACDLSVLS